MSDTVIRVENLSKKYIIGHQRTERYTTLRDVLTDAARGWGRRILHPLRTPNSNAPTREEFWALKDVSFEVKRGERLGIIGRNGAGKSTLLKILSRITEPSSGRVTIKGRVASLLEVGTGFHPELTGRENIYLNGAILGMSRDEIKRKFDEIVAFAEVEKFLDTPVKRYSSGMYVRLAFAVAAHLEPEILLVDEVLAVGDAQFQKKCLGKMGEVAREGRTVLFVSHNMGAIRSLCARCINLQYGRVAHEGETSEVIQKYLTEIINTSKSLPLAERIDRIGSGEVRFTSIRFLNDQGQEVAHVPMGSSLTIEAHYRAFQPLYKPIFGFLFVDEMGKTVLRAYSRESWAGSIQMLNGVGVVRCRFDELPLMHGKYGLHLWLGHRGHEAVDYIEFTTMLEVLRADVYKTGNPPDSNNGGLCFAYHTWEIGTAN